MATYITFLNFTEQGVKTIKDLPARITAGRQSLEAKGGKIVQYYLTLGAQDAVVVCELPDDETMAGAMLAQAGLGNLRTTTMRAFTEAEIPGVLIGESSDRRSKCARNVHGRFTAWQRVALSWGWFWPQDLHVATRSTISHYAWHKTRKPF